MYTKLGVSQEDLIKNTGDYVALQMASGRSLKGELQDRQKLQKASLEYQDNLLVLSQLTGEDVESIKKRQQEAASEYELQIYNMAQEERARQLERTGRAEDIAQAAKIRSSQKEFNAALNDLAAKGFTDLRKGLREAYITGTTSGKEASALTRLGVENNVLGWTTALRNGTKATEANSKVLDPFIQRSREASVELGELSTLVGDTKDAYFLDTKAINAYTQNRTQSVAEQEKTARELLEEQKKSNDPALKARAALTEAEIFAQVGLNKLLMEVNPLINGFDGVTTAATILAGAATSAAIALTGIAGVKLYGGAKNLLGNIGGRLGGGGAAAAAGGGRSVRDRTRRREF